jgi:hypothetical protein
VLAQLVLDAKDTFQPQFDPSLPTRMQGFRGGASQRGRDAAGESDADSPSVPLNARASLQCRPLLQHGQHRCNPFLHFAPIDDHVDGALLQQEFRALETLR